MKLVCWNVNGIRAAYKKGLLDWIGDEGADMVCLQETKARYDQLPDDLKEIPGYHASFAESQNKSGYSGLALYSRTEPEKVELGLGIERFDCEGRTMVAYFDRFVLFNIYFPNGKASLERLQYKMDYYDAFLERAEKLRSGGREVIVCGDVNTAHREIDLAHPRENEKRSGFLPEERAWMDRFVSKGYVDTFRALHPDEVRYSWWDMKTRARERNVGWRIDHFFVTEGLMPKVKAAFIEDAVTGSDHCPVGIELE